MMSLLQDRLEVPTGTDESRITNHESRLLWYVLQTKPTAEENVLKHLQNAKFETFLPKIRTMIRGRRTTRIKPLFPSYVFAHLDLANPNLFHMIKYTRGVRKILGDGVFPISVPDEMIEIIRSRSDGAGVIEQRLTLREGDEVRIRIGPFSDLIGILDKPVSAAGRVRVLLKILHHQVRCDLSAGDIERV
jgi:transcription elongation factor/antiterminator RfaH